MDPIIRIENLKYTYPAMEGQEAFMAIKGLDLEIERGSFVAIIGQNGSGKSTLAKCMNALLLPTEGHVYVDGNDTFDDEKVWDIRQTAGMVFQNPDNQIVSSIVEDDVAFGPENMGVDPGEIRRRVDEALEAVGMEKFKRSAPHLLSGGQKQRIAIAGAMAMRPKCIVFDEPTAMLDPKGRKEVMSIIKRLNGEGITCILITHFMEEAAQADKIVIMDKGVKYMEGTPREIFTDKQKLRDVGMDVPMIVDLTYKLQEMGLDIEQGVMEQEELVKELCRLK